MDEIITQIGLYWDQLGTFFEVDTGRLLEPDMLARLTLQVLLFTCSAFFSGSETALFSLSRLDLQKLRRERHPKSETLHALLDEPRRLIISILCGNELVNVAATVNMAGILVELFGPERAGWISIVVMFPLLLLFGEVTPKTIAVSNPVRISTAVVATPLATWSRLITPLRRAVRVVAGAITTWIVGEERAAANILRVDEFRAVLEDVAEEGVLDATERVLIDNLLEAGETEIVEIMTPRTRIEFLDIDTPLPEMFQKFKAIKHPRVPVCRGRTDNFVGFLHAEDVLRLTVDGTDLSALNPEDVMHAPVVVPPTKNVDEMFDFFQARRARAAIVLNEFGGVEGLITMRDIINFIFGEISENVSSQKYYREHDENTYEVPGDMRLTDFDDLTNFGIEDPRMTTIGGVVFRHLDRLPRVNDTVQIEGYTATVLDMEGHRVARVRISKAAPPAEEPISAEASAAAAGAGLEASAPEAEIDVAAIEDELAEAEFAAEADVEIAEEAAVEAALSSAPDEEKKAKRRGAPASEKVSED
jgi:CBS domain containing-hemolysin-like protein